MRSDPIEPIAIVGFSMGFPQDATTSDALWDIMMNKRTTVSEFPKERININSIYHPDTNRRGQIPVNQSHFLKDDVAYFDAPFFATSTTDAASMDPQQRLLLEYTYRALENAGMPMESVSGTKASVYTGVFSTDWQHLAYKDGEQCSTTAALGVQACFNANRISWFFNFTGNSANIDTACSSSLVALDLGCKGLRAGDEDMSIVAGCNIILSPDNMHGLTNLNMLSPDGHCYSFDHRGNGYSRGEGFGVLILKRVSDAIRDNNTIRGVIRNTGCNQDGNTPSITLPNHLSQEALIKETYRKAHLDMVPTRFFEAHGTGTSVGDPNESKAIGSAFRDFRTLEDPLWIGAIKSNIGHLEGASGIAGVIKAMLVLEKGIIPPNTNFEKLNPKIDAEFLRIQFPLQPMPWPTHGLRRASVNSFGNAGTNSHVVLDDVYHFLEERGLTAHHLTVRDPPSAVAPSEPLERTSYHHQNSTISNVRKLIMLSAYDEAGIKRQAQSYAQHFINAPPQTDPDYLDNLAYTLSFRRTQLPWKSHAVIGSLEDLCKLDELITPAVKSIETPGLAFVFTGQGANWPGMGRELMIFSAFERSIQRSETILNELGCTWLLQQELFDPNNSRLHSPELSQPLCTAIQIALSDLLCDFGIFPTAVVGHSSGEIAAAYAAGILSTKSALKLAYFRGVSSSSVTTKSGVKGAMMAVGMPKADVRPIIERVHREFGYDGLTIACINSPKNVTISGDENCINALKMVLDEHKIFARKLTISVPYHSPYMQSVAKEYGDSIEGLESGTPRNKPVAMFSSVTGKRVTGKELLSPAYWVANLVSPVQFVDAMNELLSSSAKLIRKKLDLSHRKLFRTDALIEVGPHSALQGPIQDIITAARRPKNPSYVSLLIRKTHAVGSAISAVGHLRCLGYPVAMEKVNGLLDNPQMHYMSLPNLPEYSFDHSRKYWEESRISARYRTSDQGKLDLLGKPVVDWNPMEPRWRNHLRVSEMPWIEGHVVNGVLIYPGAGMLAMVIEAANQLTQTESEVVGFEFSNVSFLKPLKISRDSTGTETQLTIQLTPTSTKPLNSWSEFRLFAYDQNDLQECCRGSIRAKYLQHSNEVDLLDVENMQLRDFQELERSISRSCTHQLDTSKFYTSLVESGLGIAHGNAFHRIVDGSYDESRRAKGRIELFQWPQNEYPQDHVLHPTTLDAILQLGIAGYMKGGDWKAPTMIPTFMRSMFVSRTGLSFPGHTDINNYSLLKMEDRRGIVTEGFVLSLAKDSLLLHFEDMRMTIIADSNGDSTEDTLGCHQIPYHIEYQPDHTLMDAQRIMQHCNRIDQRFQSPLENYINMIAHQNPNMKIMVIDLGSRTMTDVMLRVLSNYSDDGKVDGARFASFHLIAKNTTALEDSKKKLNGYPVTQFLCCDIEKEDLDVGSHLGTFDIIVVSARSEMNDSVASRLKTILSPQGWLLLYEVQNDARSNGNDVHLTPFDKCLAKHGMLFSGLKIPASKPDSLSQSVLHVYHTASVVSLVKSTKTILFVVDPDSSRQKQAAQELTDSLATLPLKYVGVVSLDDALTQQNLEDTVYILLLELENPFLHQISADDYPVFQKLLLSAKDIMVVNFAGGTDACSPEYFSFYGLARALRNERNDLTITIVSFEASSSLSLKQCGKFVDILRKKHIDRDSRTVDVEFIEIQGQIHVPRVVPAYQARKELNKRWVKERKQSIAVKDAPPLTLAIGSVGFLDTLHFREEETLSCALADDEVEVETKSVAMNFKDCLVAMGQVPSNILGQDCAGVVLRAGPATPFKAGDRVIMISSDGTFKTVVRGKASGALKIPDSLSFSAAATIPAPYGTAWMVIHRLARLQKGESILIHAAAGGTGQAAVQIAQAVGAAIFATVGSKEKKQLLMDVYNVPETHIFYSRNTSFAQGVKKLTGGRGVDVIINCLVGEELLASWECIAPYGRFIEIGKKDILSNSSLPMFAFRKNVSFQAFDGSLWFADKTAEMREDLEKLIGLFDNKTLRPPQPLQVLDISEVEEAFRGLQKAASPGKTVLEISPESHLRATLKTYPSFVADENSTFVIAGGLGGLGRATARWLAARGAKNMILLSRLGPRTIAARELLVELQVQGVRVETPACDVTDLNAMERTFAALSAEMPPIKGVFQMSIVARDCLFEDLSFDDWKIAVDCKTVGSWNLHNVLPRGMDFFIMLSSASGLAGIRGQANYDAGNTYEDALARYRVSQGEKATSLDLGAMVDDGILAENPDLLNRVMAYGTLEGITREKFYGILDYYCDPSLPLLSPMESQVAIGLSTGAGEGLESVDFSRQPMLWPLMNTTGTNSDVDGRGKSRVRDRERFAAATTVDQATEIVSQAITEKLGNSLTAFQDHSSVDLNRQLQAYGVDSLLAIELRNWIVKEFSADVAVFETQGASTLGTLSMLVVQRSTIKRKKEE